MNLSALLTEILQAEGYTVSETGPMEGSSGTTYSVSLLAETDDRRLLVDVLRARPAADQDLNALDQITTDLGLDGAILFALDGVDQGIDTAGHDDVAILDPAWIQAALGSLVLEQGTWPPEPSDQARALELHPVTIDQKAGEPEPQPEPEAPPEPQVQPSPQPSLPEDASAPEPAEPAAAEEGPPHGPEEAPAAQAEADAPEPDDSDTEWLTDPPSKDPSKPKGTGPIDPKEALKEVDQNPPDDGDAEWLSDPPSPEETKSGLPERDPQPEGSDSEWLDSSPEQPEAEAQPTEADQEASTGADAEIIEDRTRAPEPPEEEGEGQVPPGASLPPKVGGDASGTGDAEFLPSGRTPEEPESDGPTVQEVDQEAEPETKGTGFLVGGSLPIKVDEAAARDHAQASLFSTTDATLQLVPFHALAYRCTLEGDGASRDQEGRLWVSATNGQVVQAPSVNLVDEVPAPFTKLEPSVDQATAEEAAGTYLVEEMTVREEMAQTFSESSIIERVELSPRPDSVSLERLGLVYAPRWLIEGQNGAVYVDAVTGDLVPIH